MPCSDYSDADEIHSLSGQVKALTQIACELAKHCPNRALLSRESQDFIRRHEQEDRNRLIREAQDARTKAMRKLALAKLTASERRILGVR